MKKEDIITLPNERLRKRSARIRTISDEVKQTIKDMTNAAIDWENSRPHEISAALAAIQVDRLERIVIIRSDFDDKESQDFTALINPEIVKYEGEIINDYEGCLSVKDVYGKVPRYSKIRVKALDTSGEPIRLRAEGFLARVIQHEVDHTNGIVFVDHIKDDHSAFYRLDSNGELEQLDYDKHIANSDLFNE